jgi:hypothetical protein
MAEIIQFATIRSQLDPSGYTKGAQEVVRSSEQATAAVTKLDVATQQAGRNAALSADGYQKFLNRIDPVTRAQQQYATTTSKLNDYFAAGLVSQGDYARAQGLIKDKLEATVGSGNSLTRTLEGLGQGYAFVARSLGAVGIAVGAGALVSFGEKVLENAASLEHEAKVLQLSVGQYQAYREAARLAGIEVDTADTAIRKLVNSAGAAIESTGAQRTAFASLGVTANDLAGGPDAYIPKVAAALLAIGDKSVVAHDAVALFGKSGQEILPLLQQWAQGSGELTDKLKTMGLVMDDEVAAKAEEAEIRMSAAFDRLKVTAAPAVIAVTDALTGLFDNLSALTSHDWNIRIHAAIDLLSNVVPGGALLSGLAGQFGGHSGAKAPTDILSSSGTFNDVLSSQGSFSSGAPAPGTPGTSSWDKQGWEAYLDGRKEEARLVGLSKSEQSAEREAIAESVKLQELNGTAADKINHTYAGAVQILGEQGLAHARNTGSLLQQEKTLGQHEKHHEKIVDWLKIENEYALEAQRIWNENAKIISGLARQGIDALFPTSELARIEAMLEAIARIKMPDTFGGLGSLASNLAEFSFQQLQAAGTAGFKFDAEQAKSIQLMPRDQALADLQKYSDQLDALNRLWPEGSRDSELYQMKLYGLNDSIRQATIAADPFLQSIERIATEFGDQANQALKSALLDPKNTGEYAKQFAQAILGDIYDELIGNQLKKSITSGIESLFGIAPNERPTGALGSPLHVVVDAGLPGVTQSGGLLGGLGNLFGLFGGGSGVDQAANIGDLIHFIPALAEGGPVSPGGTYLVGENGPEIFRPSVGGSIIPNGNGGGMVVHIDARGAQRGVGAEIEAVMHRVAAQHFAAGLPIAISAASKAVSNRARNRGGRAA